MNSEAIESMKTQIEKISNMLTTAKQLNGDNDGSKTLEHLVKMQVQLKKLDDMTTDLIPLVVRKE